MQFDDDEEDPHAVRWYNRRDRYGNPQWTKWHYTTDALTTACGRYVNLAIEGGSFLPDTDENLDKVDCKYCKNKLDS